MSDLYYNEPEEDQYYDNEDYYTEDAHPRSQSFIGDIAGENLCQECGKRVYELEKMTADQIIYHKSCFKCSHCKRLLNLSNYSSRYGIIYCKQHFIELFNLKGHTDKIAAENQSASNGGGAESNGEEDAYLEASKLNLPEVKNMRAHFESQSYQNPSNRGFQQSQERRTSQKIGQQGSKSTDDTWTGRMDSSGRQDEQQAVEYKEDNESSEVKQEEDELPPPAITRNLVARFQSMTSADGIRSPPGSSIIDVRRTSSDCRASAEPKQNRLSHLPCHAQQNQVTLINKQNNVKTNYKENQVTSSYQHNQVTPTDKQNQVASTYIQPPADHLSNIQSMEQTASMEVVKEDDPPSEMELPEEGLTRSLVALWRSAESTNTCVAPLPKNNQKPGKSETTRQPDLIQPCSDSEYVEPESAAYQINNQTSNQTFEAVSEEDCLPPENITQSLLERFKELETSEQPVNSKRSSRNFKWDVKEVKPVNYLNQ